MSDDLSKLRDELSDEWDVFTAVKSGALDALDKNGEEDIANGLALQSRRIRSLVERLEIALFKQSMQTVNKTSGYKDAENPENTDNDL